MTPPPPAQPLFLARQSYRRRRLMDAARLLPFLGAFLFLIPLLWGGAARATASDGIYLIVVWAALIAASFVLSRALMRAPAEPPAKAPDAASGAPPDLPPRRAPAPPAGSGIGGDTGGESGP